MHPPYRHTGFTLIEMIMVIAIIAILAGLLLPVISNARNSAKEAATRATMGTIEAAISKYRRQNNGLYPLDKGNDTEIMDDGTEELGDFRQALSNIDADSFGVRGSKVDGGIIVDAWKQDIRYRPFMAYPDTSPYYDVNPDSYQLWSTGPDRECAVTTHRDPDQIGDDITNWGER